jgi:hypothetical protein
MTQNNDFLIFLKNSNFIAKILGKKFTQNPHKPLRNLQWLS